ncbi:hypothetical protein Poly30_04460 [Planctomycetes bacterium Poly30]|uniref:Uncharacterized protein n=1 Tax=Saltatorellus ferox TaxID=2528018 RepID=A0A518ELL7_9BACT|nr:hypothetical protein Poly30_04460 [Planctomycetes bacterium Poly30]
MSEIADTPLSVQGRRRRLLFRLRRATRLIEQRERIQDIGLGLLAAAVALALPAAHPYSTGNEALLRLSGETVLTQGLMYPLGRGAMEVASGLAPADAIRTLAGIAFGCAITLTLAFLRNLGFRRSATVPATFAAFATPFAWIGGTSPVDYAPGMFGAALILWSLFHQEQTTRRGYHWRAILYFGAAYMLHMETALLVPAVAWAVARHPAYRKEGQITFLAVVLVLSMSIAIGLSGSAESARMEHLAQRALAGADDYSFGALWRWAVTLAVGLPSVLFGVYQLLFARREESTRRAPAWIVPWCLVALAPVIAGSAAFAPIAPYLVPAGALGIADWLNRRGTAAREMRFGAGLLAIQVVATLVMILR